MRSQLKRGQKIRSYLQANNVRFHRLHHFKLRCAEELQTASLALNKKQACTFDSLFEKRLVEPNVQTHDADFAFNDLLLQIKRPVNKSSSNSSAPNRRNRLCKRGRKKKKKLMNTTKPLGSSIFAFLSPSTALLSESSGSCIGATACKKNELFFFFFLLLRWLTIVFGFALQEEHAVAVSGFKVVQREQDQHSSERFPQTSHCSASREFSNVHLLQTHMTKEKK